VSLKCYAQNPKELLQKSYSKCQTIQNGFYDMHMKVTFMDMKDTSWNIDCRFYFNKLKNDSLYSVAFKSELFSDGNYVRHVLYTGNEFVTLTKHDSTAIIMSKNKWINKLMDLRHNYYASFYQPFTDDKHFPLPKAADYRITGIHSYPTTYLIDKNGNVIYSESGYDESSKNKLEQVIKSDL